jgi:hypothetical protein
VEVGQEQLVEVELEHRVVQAQCFVHLPQAEVVEVHLIQVGLLEQLVALVVEVVVIMVHLEEQVIPLL